MSVLKSLFRIKEEKGFQYKKRHFCAKTCTFGKISDYMTGKSEIPAG